ncbi:hypothetical protein ACIHEI_12800 [Kitasatospora sp. NPDC051984]|uniref:hypothetical protein n=1 Tax=Kitasatospora sp. NPDC051984 TaxID=3364059 RepID=UPI0037C7605F
MGSGARARTRGEVRAELPRGRSGWFLALAALEAAVVVGLPVTLRQVGRVEARRAGKGRTVKA